MAKIEVLVSKSETAKVLAGMQAAVDSRLSDLRRLELLNSGSPEWEERQRALGLRNVLWHSCSAAVRGTPPHVLLSFSDQDGAEYRFRLPAAEAMALAGALADAAAGYFRDIAHSDKSAGTSSSAGSPNDGHVHVPVATASAAAAGE